jgi:flagellar protein FliS
LGTATLSQVLIVTASPSTPLARRIAGAQVKYFKCRQLKSNTMQATLQEGIILAYNNALSTYKETRITTASQGQLLLMLYDEAIRQLDRALELMELNNSGKKDPGRIELFGKAIIKAQDILTELMVSLDFDQGEDIAKNLLALYTWFSRELLDASIRPDTVKILTVRNMMNELRTAWHEIAIKNAAETSNREVQGVNIAG